MTWIDDIIEEITTLGLDHADKQAAANLLDDGKKSILAELKLTFTDIKADAGRETEARATQSFQNYLKTGRIRHYKTPK